MLEGRYLLFGDDYGDVIKVRNQCLDVDCNSNDSMDSEAIHVIVYENNHPIACGRMLIRGEDFLFDRIYVIESKRRNRVGDFVVRLLIEKANLMCAEDVLVSCKEDSRVFFESIGFRERRDLCDRNKDQVNMCLNLETFLNKKSCCK